jgi:DNA repair protein RecO
VHHVYHTEALILGNRGYGEDSRYYFLFTKDLGMVYASASGVRKISSKLRFILHDFAYVKVDLVQGRDFWRITSASKTGEFENLLKNSEVLKIYANIARLLRRLLAGVEQNEQLFIALLDGLKMLEKSGSAEEQKSIETNTVLMILDKLGYIESAKVKTRAEAINIINQALRETHL